MTRRLHVVAVVLAVFASHITAAPVVIAPSEPTLLACHMNPQVAVYLPAGGDKMFYETASPAEGAQVVRTPDLLCRGETIHLTAASLDGAGVSIQTAETTGSLPWWGKAGMALRYGAYRGVMPELRIGPAVAVQLAAQPEILDAVFNRIEELGRISGFPMVTLDAPDAVRHQLCRQLRARLPQILVGLITDAGIAPLHTAGFDYVIVRPDDAPPGLGGQALMSWGRSLAGQRPVLVESIEPSLVNGLFHLTAGAAGIVLEPRQDFAPGVEDDHATEVIGMAFAARQVTAKGLHAAPQLMKTGVLAAAEVPGHVAVIVMESAGAVPIEFPPGPGRTAGLTYWFSPGLNQMIVWPVEKPPQAVLRDTRPPSSGIWILGRQHLTEHEIRATTVTSGLEIERNPPEW